MTVQQHVWTWIFLAVICTGAYLVNGWHGLGWVLIGYGIISMLGIQRRRG